MRRADVIGMTDTFSLQEILDANAQLLADGLIEPTGGTRNGQPVYRITEKGVAYERALDAHE